jgi:hypothetical protein
MTSTYTTRLACPSCHRTYSNDRWLARHVATHHTHGRAHPRRREPPFSTTLHHSHSRLAHSCASLHKDDILEDDWVSKHNRRFEPLDFAAYREMRPEDPKNSPLSSPDSGKNKTNTGEKGKKGNGVPPNSPLSTRKPKKSKEPKEPEGPKAGTKRPKENTTPNTSTSTAMNSGRREAEDEGTKTPKKKRRV